MAPPQATGLQACRQAVVGRHVRSVYPSLRPVVPRRYVGFRKALVQHGIASPTRLVAKRGPLQASVYS
jgi:hypothetical protein